MNADLHGSKEQQDGLLQNKLGMGKLDPLEIRTGWEAGKLDPLIRTGWEAGKLDPLIRTGWEGGKRSSLTDSLARLSAPPLRLIFIPLEDLSGGALSIT